MECRCVWQCEGLPLRIGAFCRYVSPCSAASSRQARACRFAWRCLALPLGLVKLWDARPLSTVRAGGAAARSLVRSRTAMPLRRVLVRRAAWSCVGLPLGYVRSRYVKGRRLGVSSNAGDCRCVQYGNGVPLCDASSRRVLPRRYAVFGDGLPLGVAK